MTDTNNQVPTLEMLQCSNNQSATHVVKVSALLKRASVVSWQRNWFLISGSSSFHFWATWSCHWTHGRSILLYWTSTWTLLNEFVLSLVSRQLAPGRDCTKLKKSTFKISVFYTYALLRGSLEGISKSYLMCQVIWRLFDFALFHSGIHYSSLSKAGYI